MQLVGVLKLVDEDVPEARLIMGAQRRIVREQFETAQQQFREIDDAFALALLVVGFVEFDEFAVEVVGGVDVFRPQALLFGIVDEVLEIFRRVLFVVDVEALHQTLDRGELVGGIENLEGGGQTGVAMMCAQHAVAQTVEGADPHAARVDGQERRQARHHFARGFVGEGHREDRGRRRQAVLDKPRDTRDQHAGLAAARAGEDERGLVGERDGGVLFGVEIG